MRAASNESTGRSRRYGRAPYRPPCQSSGGKCDSDRSVVWFCLRGQSCRPQSTAPRRYIQPTSDPSGLRRDHDIYLRMNDIMRGYAASDRLYLSPEERRKQIDTLLNAPKAVQDLDVSDILPVFT